jgi:Na(+)-translocating NADH:ubiquinone oxidoreductase F subunit
VGLRTYATREQNGGIELDLSSAGGAGAAVEETTYRFRVVFSRNVATFIRELTLEPEADSPPLRYEPGQYLQFNIPAYGSISFSALQIAAPFDEVWRAGHVFDYRAENILPMRRNYSLASNPDRDAVLMLNIRIATPPRGQECNAGSGSTYMWSLRPGDRVTAIGPFGDFRIKPTDREMVYIGGGAGMAPLRSHISNLLETQASPRAIRYFYGARSRQELFYVDFFRKREESHPNFAFYPALSEPLPQDAWEGPAGYIHEVVRDAYLKSHPRLSEVEFYLCGPPPMIRATQQMLRDLGVRDDHVAFDEFT